MDPLRRIAALRDVGRVATEDGVEWVRLQLLDAFRRSMGTKEEPPPACQDPEVAFFPPGCITREMHADVPPMLIGGVAALLFQMLHPLAMAGVADHSNFRRDPVGRLERTATFLTVTTYHSRAEAEAAIGRVRRLHQTVVGTARDGRPYSATDPALVEWVHATEVHSFLAAWRAFGHRSLTAAEQDRYLAEMARVAIGLGARAEAVPRTVDELEAYFERVRPELAMTPEARSARDFIVRGVGRWPHELATYALLVAAAQSTIPGWARRQLGLVSIPAGDRLVVRPAARALASAMRWVVAARPEAGPEPRAGSRSAGTVGAATKDPTAA
ncbi:MAG TPA: oxygenase MpaB family protein [Acidimicrobiales bacterium]|nr:oxygenase MpaB family protein [Acidimicrobiales bacterium]